MKVPHTRLADAELADRLADAAKVTGTQTEPMTLAIGVSALPGDAAVTLDVLARLRLKGFRLWLDDADTEAQFEGLPLAGVRFTGSLVSRATTEPEVASALQDAIDRARAHGLMAIGLGCASAAEFALLLESGASHAQGGFVADVMPVPDLAARAREWTAPALVPGQG